MTPFRFRVDGKHFENGAFRKRWCHDNYMFALIDRVFLKHKSKMTGDCSVFKFLRRSVDGKNLMRFQSETSVFKFLRRSVDGKHLMRFQSETSVFKFLRRSLDGKHLMRFQSETSVFKFLRGSVGVA